MDDYDMLMRLELNMTAQRGGVHLSVHDYLENKTRWELLVAPVNFDTVAKTIAKRAHSEIDEDDLEQPEEAPDIQTLWIIACKHDLICDWDVSFDSAKEGQLFHKRQFESIVCDMLREVLMLASSSLL